LNLSTPDVLGSTLLTLLPLSNDVSAPLQVSLTPGWYAVIFGSGLFGATGHGAFPYNNTPVGNPGNFRRLGNQYLDEADTMRMFVEAVPEPAGAMLALTGLAILAARARRCRNQLAAV
jgi:MYXO-CTERM domain-containing protein